MNNTTTTIHLTAQSPYLWVHADGTMQARSRHAQNDDLNVVASVSLGRHLSLYVASDLFILDANEFAEHMRQNLDLGDLSGGELDDLVKKDITDYQAEVEDE